MENKDLPQKAYILELQREEMTEWVIYTYMASIAKDLHNKKALTEIAEEEKRHADAWKEITQTEVTHNFWIAWLYILTTRCFGLTFGLKLLEHKEHVSGENYYNLTKEYPQMKPFYEHEKEHEREVIDMLKDKPLDYLGSIVLGLNDALIELTGILAGLTLGIQNGNMIASVGIITGIAAALSMAGSEYLSTKTDQNEHVNPLTASFYTGIAYIITVALLITPYLLFSNVFIALGFCVITAIIIIAIFNFYVSIAKGYLFRNRFIEMVSISLTVAFISFIIGYIVNKVFNIAV